MISIGGHKLWPPTSIHCCWLQHNAGQCA